MTYIWLQEKKQKTVQQINQLFLHSVCNMCVLYTFCVYLYFDSPQLMPLLSEPFVQVSVGPFTIVKSIDSLTEALADMLSAERKDFTLSSKNVGKMMGPLYLHAFRPLTFDAFVSLFL